MHQRILLITLCFSIASCSKPMASFLVAGSDHVVPKEVHFENKSKKAEKYIWEFGDGSSSDEYAPKHKYIKSGKYTVVLTALKGNKKSVKKQEIFFEAPKDCIVEMETSEGALTIKLFDATPLHRDNFIKLIEAEYYNGILFHRVIQGFMIQAGDPESKHAKSNQRLGSGGPGYKIPAEIVNDLVHVKGALAAARQGDEINPKKESSGSQFYIVQGRPVPASQIELLESQKAYKLTQEQRDAYINVGGSPTLDKEYTVFGQVIRGMEVIDKIAATQTDASDRPVNDVKILNISVVK